VIDGFLAQFEAVRQGLVATVNRAVKENQDMIVDGVHVLPNRLKFDIPRELAIVIPLMLVVTNKKTLGKRLKLRAKEQPGRASTRYLKRLDQIWQLQSFLIAEAERQGIPLISNDSMEKTLEEVLLIISHSLSGHFPPG
jgi:2-phosphoglycerate kinase